MDINVGNHGRYTINKNEDELRNGGNGIYETYKIRKTWIIGWNKKKE